MKIKKLTILILCFCIIFFTGYFLYNLYLKDNSKSVSGATELNGDYLKGFLLDKISEGYDSKVFAGHKETKIIKINNIKIKNIQNAKSYINDIIFVLDTMYRDVRSPYPGALSSRIGCADEFKPKKNVYEPFDYYLIFASERFTYGVCSDDLIYYSSIMFFIFCEKGENFYQIEVFIPKGMDISEDLNGLKTIKCK